MKTLLPHQLDIVRDDKEKVGLWLGTGVGKTLIALSLARGKTLVIAPKTQKEDKNWEKELGEAGIALDLTVISKETFRRDWEKLPAYETLILDEADQCLGATPNVRYVRRQPVPKTSQIFEAVRSYITRHKPKRIYLATATITRTPMCVWAAAIVLGYSWDWYKFRDVFYVKLPMPGREVWVPRKDRETKERLANLIKKIGYVGRLEDYSDVPDQTYKTIFVDTTTRQDVRIQQLELEYPDPIALIGKIHQVENGVLSGNEYMSPEMLPCAKNDKLEDLMIEFPRMVVFAKYTMQIHEIEKIATKLNKTVFVLDGGTKNRGEMIKTAQSCDDYVFICQAQVSAGWELPDCPVMVFASMTYSAADRIQAEGRIQRQKNIKKNLYIDLVVRGGVDEAVYDCIVDKKDFNEMVYARKLYPNS